MSKFVVEYDGTPSVSHTIIAQNTDNEARSVRLLIENHLNDFEEFGVLSFEMTKPLNTDLGGRPSKIYYLNEPQATLLLTYLQNTPIVREFKKALVKEFYQMREKLTITNQKFTEILTALSEKSSEADEYKNKYFDAIERENLLLREKLDVKAYDFSKHRLNSNLQEASALSCNIGTGVKFSRAELEEAIRLLDSGWTRSRIAKHLHRSVSAVSRNLRKNYVNGLFGGAL
jgi:phage protein by glimmer/critica|nr:MAG TPA: regulatory protein [Caudoviricetes sp.]DAV12702.1 MAG TPA: regulatory protein [Caudoviricetes sp.]